MDACSFVMLGLTHFVSTPLLLFFSCCTSTMVSCNATYESPISVANPISDLWKVFVKEFACASLTLDYTATKSGVVSVPPLRNVGVYDVSAMKEDTILKTCMVVMYDPSGGFVTGGGWIQSPAEAYRKDPDMTGKAHFASSARYKKGMTVPEGETTFVFPAGNFKFKSTKYDWLIVEGGTKAKYKGSGELKFY